MSRRKKASGGQAIVMVTLALFSMCGMMGLAVDLGWSFFVQKIAQASADGAALAAVQETYKRNGGGLGTLTCGATADCQPITACDAIGASSNLYNGCLYATRNGFSVGGENGRQNVTIQADVTTPPPTVPGVTDIKYWVTVRTAQSVPQLFSSVLGNTQGTVSAIATAAISGSQLPGSFYGMNHEGDCITGLDTSSVSIDCGVDIDIGGSSGSTACTNVDGTSSGVVAKLCAPAGILLSSTCNGSSAAGCGSGSSGATGTNFAGQTAGASKVWAQSGTQIRGDGWVNSPADWLPANTLSNQSSQAGGDPLKSLPQPPLVSPSQPLCAVTGGSISGTVGPYQYYAVDALGNATGVPIKIDKNTIVTFDPNNATCPGNNFGTSAGTGGFKTFTFWGGLNIDGNSNTTVTFGSGQYVMAGTSSVNGAVFNASGSTITGTNGGNDPTMFLTTDGSYSAQGTALAMPSAMVTAGVTLHQGFTSIKNTNASLEGITSTAGALTDYKGVLFWQDRRNSILTLDQTNGDFISRTRPATVTDTSPQNELQPGNATLRLDGLMYQPRGAWFYLNSGGASGSANLQLKMITGALTCGATGCGNTSIILKGPGAPTTIYVTSLIQ